MNRPKDIETKQKLLAKAVEYVLTNGVANISLRPMAAEMGTTARMLMHHFGSKEHLLSEALAVIEAEFIQRAEHCFSGDKSVAETVTALWQETSTPEMELALRAMFEIWGEALIQPQQYEAYLASMVKPWVELLQRQIKLQKVSVREAKTLATLIMGSFVGLQLVRLTEGDDKSCGLALQGLLAYVEHSLPK